MDLALYAAHFFGAESTTPTVEATHHLRVERFKSNNDATLSRIYLVDTATGKNTFLCHGLEDEARAVKVAGETRIPAGVYRVDLRREGGFHSRYAERFKSFHRGMIWLRNVPQFSWVLWHVGNTDDDTAGCLLLGNARGYRLTYSAKTYQRVYEVIAPMIERGEIETVEYTDND